MEIELPDPVEERLRSFAASVGRNVPTLVEEAVLRYLDIAALTDVDPDQIAETQVTLMEELPEVSGWKAGEV